MNISNKLLLRQIKKHFSSLDAIPENILAFVEAVNESYDHYEKDRKMLERSIELSSKEMIELNTQLRKESEENSRQVFEKLKESLVLLNEKEEEVIPKEIDYAKLAHIADILKNETRKRRIAEKERAQREEHLNASQHIARIGSWELDLTNTDPSKNNTLFWSDETYHIFGSAPDPLVSTSDLFYSRVPLQEHQLIQDAVNKAISTGELYELEHHVILPDGIEKIVHERAEIIIDPLSQKPLKMIGTVQDITDRKAAEALLEKTNRELRLLFENMQEVFFSIDMKTYKLLQMSTICEDVYGYTVAEFAGNSNLWFEVILDEDKKIVQANEADMRQGKPIVNEYRIHHKNNTVRWLETKITPTLDANGELLRIDGITSDITKRKLAETALKDSEHKFRSLIENNTDAILVVNELSEILFSSDSHYRIMGYTPDEVMGVNSLQFIYKDDLPVVQEHLERVLDNPDKTIGVVYRRVKKDGSYIWCEGTATNLLHDPAIKGIIINFRDITERKNAEKALRGSEYKFRSLIENSSDAIIVINEKGEFTYASDSLFRISGFRPKEVIGHSIFPFIHPAARDEAYSYLKALIDNKDNSSSIVYKFLRKDGTYIWCEGVARNMIDQPMINGIVFNFRDITDRKTYENALKASNENLKKSNTELDKFVYSVSHDLRAPLSSMLGVVSLLESEATDSSIMGDLALLKNSINKLDGFIQDILDYSRNSRAEVKTEEINFKEILNDATSHLKYMKAGNEAVKINMNISEGTIFYSDGSRISIILNNLISNSIRYSNPKVSDPYVQVEIITGPKEATITVKDNGIGISKENQPRIFEMFYRASKNSVGSGLGLYILKETVEKLKGTISFQSELDKGTEFKITIPNLFNS